MTHRNRTLALTCAFIASLLSASDAHAIKPKFEDPPIPEPTPEPEPPPEPTPEPALVVIDLGNYDPSTSPHPEYGLVLTPDEGAAMGAVAGGATACPNDPPAYTWSRTWRDVHDYGNQTFGAGYEALLFANSLTAAGTSPDTIMAVGSVRGLATVFGSTNTIFYAQGGAYLAGNQGSLYGSLSVLGQSVWSTSASGTLVGQPSVTVPFFQADKWFWLGPVPIHVTASLNGEIGVKYNTQTSGNTIHLAAEPWGRGYAYASAAADLIFASAGIEGELTLLQVSAPSTANVSIYPTTVHYDVNSDATITGLNGRISAFATLIGFKWVQDIVSWPPLFSETLPIVHANNCDTTVVRPVCGSGTCEGNETYENCPSDCAAPPPPPEEQPGGPEPMAPICKKYPWKCGLDLP